MGRFKLSEKIFTKENTFNSAQWNEDHDPRFQLLSESEEESICNMYEIEDEESDDEVMDKYHSERQSIHRDSLYDDINNHTYDYNYNYK